MAEQTQTPVDKSAQIKKQIEFYFSDSNFSRDKFLRACVAQNEEGYCQISTLLSFARLKAMTEDIEEIAKACKDSDTVVVSEDGKSIKRKNPLPAVDTSEERTVYTKGWADGSTIESISEVMSKFGKILSVRIRKQKDKKPKPSAWIEYSNVDEVKACLADPPKDFIVKTKKEYTTLKKEEIKKKKEEKKRKSEGESGEPSAKKQKTGKKEKEGKEGEEKEEKEKERPQGTLVHMKDVAGEMTREKIKEAYGEGVAWVDYQKGDAEGTIRFSDADLAKKAVESKKEIDGKAPALTLYTEEESTAYWQKYHESRNKTKGKGGRGGRGRGGRGGKRGGRF